jgi:SPP1 gp7 family putative phage head morphogenesis protein
MSKYWEQRSTQRELEATLIAEKYLARMEVRLKEAQQDVLQQINAFYGRYAKDNKITLSEARKTLNSKEKKEFKEVDLKRFREMALSGNPEYEPLLNAISYRVRISRLEALNAHVEMIMLQLYGGANGLQEYTYTGLSEIYKNTYYHTMFDLAAFGAAGTVQYLGNNTMKEILSYNWSGKEFSTRIWGHQKQTIDDIKEALERSFAAGLSLDRTAKAIMEKTNVAYSRVEALVRTESNFFHNIAAQNSYVDADLEKYEVLSTLDLRTSDICREKDGKIYLTNDYEPGNTAPPFHVRCRTTTIPYFDESEYMAREKRQSIDGLVDSKPFEEWIKQYQ